MAEIQETNVCCLDLTQGCIEYLKSLGLNVYEGSLGSVFSFQWSGSYSYSRNVLLDAHLPDNLHEYHVFIGDTDTARRREYKDDEHQLNVVTDPEERCLTCNRPINRLDLRPYGSSLLGGFLKDQNKHKIIKVVFLGKRNYVSYTSNMVGYNRPESMGPFSNYEAWSLLCGEERSGNRVVLEDNRLSRVLYEGKLNQVKYYYTFYIPYVGFDDKKDVDPGFTPLLKNENGECVSYLYQANNDNVYCVLPQVEDKAAVLKSLFEDFLFTHFSEYFPDIEAKRWIHATDYALPEEIAINNKIEETRKEYEAVIASLEEEKKLVSEKFDFLKSLLTGTGDQLVKAVKNYLEWLGFEDVVDKDETLAKDDMKEEDLYLNYEGQLVLFEIKGINRTSTDAECSQINKIVLRRMKQQKITDVHGVYVVNNQKNVEPRNRQMPPFNDYQISDAVNQDRTLVYTTQLFALYSDIENGYISKESARKNFMIPGLADFHQCLASLGVPYHYYQEDTVICMELNEISVSIGEILFYKDNLGRLVDCKIESIEQDKMSKQTVLQGKVGVKLDQKVPRGREMLKLINN